MMYQTFAALFVTLAFNIEMPITTQIAMLLLLMVTSKGIAGVPRASLVVAAATLPAFGLPAGGPAGSSCSSVSTRFWTWAGR
jgi:Na+/H+-dicarboxylate symporter